MAPKRYLTIDTSSKRIKAHDYTLYFEEEIGSEYSKICLKSVYIQHENDSLKLFAFALTSGGSVSTIYKPLHIHCSMLNRDDNFVNGEKSDVLATLYPDSKSQKFMLARFNNSCGKQISPSNYIRLYLTNFDNEPIENNGKYYIIYEIEFS